MSRKKKGFVLCGWVWYDHVIMVVHVTLIHAAMLDCTHSIATVHKYIRFKSGSGLTFSMAVRENLGDLVAGEEWADFFHGCERKFGRLVAGEEWADFFHGCDKKFGRLVSGS